MKKIAVEKFHQFSAFDVTVCIWNPEKTNELLMCSSSSRFFLLVHYGLVMKVHSRSVFPTLTKVQFDKSYFTETFISY